MALDHSHNPLVRYFKLLGPGLVTGASDDDPSGVTTSATTGRSWAAGAFFATSRR